MIRTTAFAVAVAVALAGCSSTTGSTRFPTGVLRITSGASTITLAVQIARTAEQRERGLMGRQALAPDVGMVFLEEGPTQATFWMKDTLIPLSIAFWGADGRIVDVQDMQPCHVDPCPLYTSTAPYVGAVEVHLGFFAAHGIRAGDGVQLTEAPPSST